MQDYRAAVVHDEEEEDVPERKADPVLGYSTSSHPPGLIELNKSGFVTRHHKTQYHGTFVINHRRF